MKIPIQNVYYLLSYAWDRLEAAENIAIDLSDYDDSLNLLARILVGGCARLHRKGLEKVYIPHDQEYKTVKGKILFKESLSNRSFNYGRAYCSFDEFSTNHLHNQILKSTLYRLAGIESIDRTIVNQIWENYFRFHSVDVIDLTHAQFSKVRIHRNNTEYDLLLRVCELILQCCALDEQSGKYIFKDFIRDERAMAGLFEKFVFNFYKLEQSGYKVRREDIYWNATPVFDSDLSLLPKMQTDISLESWNRKIIIDTKYYSKTLAQNFSEKFHAANLYQLYAYLSNLEKSQKHPMDANTEGILLYPLVDEALDHSYIINGHSLRLVTIDLNDDWRSISDKLLRIVA